MILKYITNQTQDSYGWTSKLLDDIPLGMWDSIPENVNSNLTWQVGHLIMSFYFHTVMVIKGHNMEVLKKIPLQEYSKLFTKSPAEISVGKTDAKELLSQLKFMQEVSIQTINSLSDDDLQLPLEKTDIPHPIAKTKLEALDWNVKHTMWHCGQIAVLKRLLDKSVDFGLKVDS